MKHLWVHSVRAGEDAAFLALPVDGARPSHRFRSWRRSLLARRFSGMLTSV